MDEGAPAPAPALAASEARESALARESRASQGSAPGVADARTSEAPMLGDTENNFNTLQKILFEIRRQGAAIERLESRFDAADSKANRNADHHDLGLDYHKVNEMLEDIRSLRIRSRSRQAGMRWRFRRLIRSTGRMPTSQGELRRPSFW
eukprot:6445498-Prymnesium_polylepis.1